MTKLYNDVTIYRKGLWKEISIHDQNNVRGFFGDYRFLSNTWPCRVWLDGVEYPSVENEYKAWRWKPEDRKYFETCSSLEAIKYNKENIPNGPSLEEWEAQKVSLMRSLLRQKFDPSLNLELASLLFETREKFLAETNWWEDLFWGENKEGVGQNNLGKLLMETRQEYFEEKF